MKCAEHQIQPCGKYGSHRVGPDNVKALPDAVLTQSQAAIFNVNPLQTYNIIDHTCCLLGVPADVSCELSG